jgi:hypothetical protein
VEGGELEEDGGVAVDGGMAGDLGVELGLELVQGVGQDGAGLGVEELAADLVGEAGAFLEGFCVEFVFVLEFLSFEGFAVVLETVDVGQATDEDLLGLVGLVVRELAVDVIEVAVEDEEGVVLLVVGGGLGVLDEGVGEVGGGELGEGLLGEEAGGDDGEEQQGAEEGERTHEGPRRRVDGCSVLWGGDCGKVLQGGIFLSISASY